MIVGVLIGVTSLLLLLGGSRVLHGRRVGFNPWVAMMSVWTVAVCLYLASPFGLYRFQPGTWLLIAGALTSFSAGYGLVVLGRSAFVALPSPAPIPTLEPDTSLGRPVAILWRSCLIWFLVFFSLFLVSVIRQYGANPMTIVFRLRPELVESGAPLGYYYYYAAQLLVPLGVLMWRHVAPHRARHLWVSFAALASLWLTSGRTNLLIASTWVIASLLLERGPRPIRFRTVLLTGGSALLALTMFVLLGSATGKTYENSGISNTERAFVPEALVSPYLYAVGSLPALDQVIHGRPPLEGSGIPSGYSYRFVQQLAAAGGANVIVPDANLPDWPIPYPFNTVTFLGPLVSELGRAYALLVVAFMGGLAAWAYLRWLAQPSIGSLLLASLCIVVLLQSPIAFRGNELWLWVGVGVLVAVVRAEGRALQRSPASRAGPLA